VTRDRPETLHKTLAALRQYVSHPAEYIVVDNGSTDPATLAQLTQCEQVGWTVVRNEQNLGLSKATNQGLALGKYPVLVHLDDDCLLQEPGWNQKLASYFQ
jgi:glycosyltransferase involved in cell wall biosynthesis